MKKLIFILTLGSAIISCHSNPEVSALPATARGATVASLTEIPASDAEFSIDKAIKEGDIWVFSISHSGGCDPDFNFQFYNKPKLTLDCVVDTIHVVLKTKNNCKRLDYTDVKFDLNAMNLCSRKIVFKGGRKDLEIVR